VVAGADVRTGCSPPEVRAVRERPFAIVFTQVFHLSAGIEAGSKLGDEARVMVPE
jgi:hypothetical protein